VRNSWSNSWGDNGSYRIHLSTLQRLSRYVDYKAFVV
jgi:C1A family cysteine protease